MASNDETVFHDGDSLQDAIALAVQERKALLCFVFDDGEESTRWEGTLLDHRLRRELTQTTVSLKLKAGSEQAGFLNAVAQISSIPAVVIIQNAQVVANYQSDSTTFDAYQQALQDRFKPSNEESSASVTTSVPVSKSRKYIELPSSEGRMRLPNNAFDHIRKLTIQYLAAGVSGPNLLRMQLKLLRSLGIELISSEVKAIEDKFESITEPSLSDKSQNLLLNTPAAKVQGNSDQADSSSTSSHSAPTLLQAPLRTHPNSVPPRTSSEQQSDASTLPRSPPESSTDHSSSTPPVPQSTHSQAAQQQQRQDYVRIQQSREAAQRAERDRIKSQIAADRQARREGERSRKEADRNAELDRLRTINSTTTDPKSTDIRIQVRTFDGSTIRNTFPHTATINSSLRPWIDVSKNPSTDRSVTEGKPYDLKVILTPLPNRTIEAGVEEMALSEIEGIAGSGSCTFVMVPVKGFVDSYAEGSSGVTGMLGTVVGGGFGLVSGAAGMVVGGLGRLFGAGAADQGQANTIQNEAQPGNASTLGGTGGSLRVRTLADQRAEETERRKKDQQLYNGNQLNFEPRKDDEEGSGGGSRK